MLQDTTSSTKGYNTGIKTDNMGPTKDEYLVLPEFLLEPEQDPFETPPIYYPNAGENQPALAKLNWWKIGLGALSGFLTGGPAGAVVGAIAGYLASKPAVFLPPGEFDTITNWLKNDFTPYFNTITAQLNTILGNFSAASLPQLNEVSKKLCIMQNFYANVNNDTFLSQEGIDFRNSLVAPYCEALQNLIQQTAASVNAGATNTVVNNNSINIPILPQPQSCSTTCVSYAVGKGTISSGTGGVKITPTPTPTPTTTVTQTATSTNPTISNLIVRKPLVLLGIGALVTALLWPKKKKSKN